jgi:hypothetical protein
MQCQKQIKGNGVFHWRQCKNDAVVKRDETWYCAVHDPEKENERLENKDKKQEQRQEQLKLLYLAKYLSKNKSLKK